MILQSAGIVKSRDELHSSQFLCGARLPTYPRIQVACPIVLDFLSMWFHIPPETMIVVNPWPATRIDKKVCLQMAATAPLPRVSRAKSSHETRSGSGVG